MNKRGMIAELIAGFVVILIGITLVPVISKQVNLMGANLTSSGLYNNTSFSEISSITILNWVPMLFGLAIAAIAIFIVFRAFSRGESDYEPGENYYRYKEEERTAEKLTQLKASFEEVSTPKSPSMTYQEKMEEFNNKKTLSDKDLEKNL